MTYSDFERLTTRIAKELDRKVAVKESVSKKSRELRKRSKQLIQQIHKGKKIEKSLLKLQEDTKKLLALLEKNSALYGCKDVEYAVEEFSECLIFNSLVKTGRLPNPEKLKLPYKQFILGLGDVVGELRRLVLACLLNREIKEAYKYFEIMKKTYHALMVFEHPIIRRKQDIARNLIEKTMGELVIVAGAGL